MTTEEAGDPVAAAPDSGEPLPNLVIAGVAKAGTTSLFRYLAQHPDVCPSSVKEARYFTALRYGEPLPPLSEYARLFAGCDGARYRMEATPGYYPGGLAVARAVEDLLPDTRVIVSFRDPVQRCWSWYRFVRSTGRIPKDMGFAGYLDRCTELHADGADARREHQPFWGLGGGCYDSWIDDWLEVFGKRLHITYFEDLVVRPQAVTEEVCRWLGVDDGACDSFAYHVENRTVQYKNRRLQRAALTVNKTAERFFSRHPELKRTLRGAYYRVNADTRSERLDERSRERLAAFYAPHNARLATSLVAAGRDRLPSWLAPTGGRP
jgi:Sulfotransferase family